RATGRLTSAKRRITPYHPGSFSESCSDLSHCRRSTKGLVPDIEREAVSGHRPGIALAVILACQLVMVLDGTIVNIALPEIQHGLGLTDAGRSWVVNAYLLTFGGLLLLGGRAGDILGRRRVLVGGVVLFTVASLAGTGWALLVARALPGAGARRPPRARWRWSSATPPVRPPATGPSACSRRWPGPAWRWG